MSIVPSCGSTKDQDIAGPASANAAAGRTDFVAQTKRTCSLNFSFPAGTSIADQGNMLRDYLQPKESVSDIEPPVTACLTMGSNSATFKIEFEENDNIFSQTIAGTSTGTSVKTLISTKSSTAVEIIFMDSRGLVQLKGNKSGSRYALVLKYYDFPSYEQAYADALAEYQEACDRDGYKDWTLAQCQGYAPQPASNKGTTLQQARTILDDTSKTTTLGTLFY